MDIQNIKQLMKSKKINQIQLAKISGVSLSTIRQIMCGSSINPRFDTIQAIENALGIPAQNYSNNFAVPYLTTNEEKLIKIYRSIPEDNRDLFLSIAEEFATDKSKSENKQIEKINLRRA